MKTKKLYLSMATVATVFLSTLFAESVFALDRKGAAKKTAGAAATVSTSTTMQVQGQNSFKLTSVSAGMTENIPPAGSKNSKGSTSGGTKGTNGSGGNSGPSCYVWKKVGTWNDVKLDLSDDKSKVYISGKNKNEQIQLDSESYNGSKNPMWEDERWKNGTITQEERQEVGETINTYMVLRNPAARDLFTPGGKCGGDSMKNGPKANNTGQVFFSVKPLAGDPDIEDDIAKAVRQGIIDVDLKETGDGSYTAKVDFGSKDFEAPGLKPDKIHNIYYMWTVRIPDKNDPFLKTANYSTMAGKASVPANLNMPMSISSSDGNLDKGLFANRLGVAFRTLDSGSSASGSNYSKNTKSNLFEDPTITYLQTMLSSEPAIAGAVKSNASSVFEFAKYEKKTGNTSSYSIPSNVRALNGKVLVNVSVIVDAEYSVETGLNGEITKFRFPLGYVSSGKSKTFSSCAALSSAVGKLVNADLNQMTDKEKGEALNTIGGSCEVTEWKEGKAIAKVYAIGTGEAVLDGTASQPPQSRRVTYNYTMDQKSETCEIDPETGDKKDPDCEDKLILENMQLHSTATPWKRYTITGYYWHPNHRIDMVGANKGKKEIDMKNYSSPNSVMYGELNNGNTYACLGITTSAGKSYGAFAGSIPGVSKQTTYTKTDKAKGRSGKSPLQIVDSGTYAYCDAIITEEKDRRVIENWGN